MKLDRLVLVNWGQLRPGNFDMGDMTLLTGETGSGKSTMLDGLQTIMTAANKGIMNYNPGQDEVTQGQRKGKTKRTLESYIVGAEYNNFSRKDGAQGFMAAVFRPSKGEEHLKPFTALVAASARVEGSSETRQAKLESLALVIVDDAALSFEDFMKDIETNECISVERIARHLQSKYSKVQDFSEKKMDYLCALYGRFRGKTSVTKDEAANAAKAWVQSIAYRPIGSVHELVRDEILDFDEKQLQQDIERIGGLMRQVSNLRQESVRLQANVVKLTHLQSAIHDANKAHESQVLQGMVVAKLQLKADDEAIALKRRQKSKASEDADEETEKIKAWDSRIDVLDGQRITLSARLQGIPVHSQKQELDLALTKATAQARISLEDLSRSLLAAGLLEQRARELISKPIPESCKMLRAAVELVAQAYRETDFTRLAACQEKVLEASSPADLNVGRLYELVQAVSGVNQGIDSLHEALIGQNESVTLVVAVELSGASQIKARADDRVRDLGGQRAKLAQGKVQYPPMVERGVNLLNEQFPQANAQVLCDLVEPNSEKWQAVIEGYLGGNRFNLIVHTEWEARCTDFLKSRGVFAKVIQGALCLKGAEGRSLPSESIVHELKSANPIAWAYLVDQYGGVVKATNTEALRQIARGITLEGVASAGRAMFAIDKVANVFGKKARQDALARVTQELDTAQGEADTLGSVKDFLESVKASMQGLKQPHFDGGPLRECGNIIEKTRDALASLDITELVEMEASLKTVVEEIKGFQESIAASRRKEGELDAFIKAAELAIKGIQASKQGHLEAFELQIQKLKQLVAANPVLAYPVLMADVEAQISEATLSLEDAKTKLKDLESRPDHLLLDARQALSEYNNQAKADERFVVELQQRHDAISFDANYTALVALAQSVANTLDGLRSIGLYNNSRELDKAERSFHDVFTKQFCVEIKSRVDEGIRTLRQMNAELKNLKFGSDSFSIDWSRWEPEFEDYLSFFEAVTKLADSAEPLDLFGEVALSERHAHIRDRLVKLLLDDNHERATKELLRIADYRNYRHYDIINDTSSGGRVKLSEWGTGSGGQLETPAYIVRAAVVTNRLKLFEKGPSLKLLVNDESFAKMDEPRARAVLGFLRDKLDLQVVSAMPTMKAGALKDEFNREYSFTRLKGVVNGELDFISECDERIFKVDKMRELWDRQRVIAREKAKQLFDLTNPAQDAPALESQPS
jgi:energy-coupling factor transporter ATP-binding protein EcfA2